MYVRGVSDLTSCRAEQGLFTRRVNRWRKEIVVAVHKGKPCRMFVTLPNGSTEWLDYRPKGKR